MSIKKMPSPHEGHRQRMKERLLHEGLEHFSGHEVLEVLLYYALPYRDTNELGHRLEQTFGGLAKVLEADYRDLIKVEGVTPHVATLIVYSGQLARRYQREQNVLGTILYDSTSMGKYLLPWFVGAKDESVVLMSMDNRYKVLNTTRIFEGSVNSTQFNIRNAVHQALRDNATIVVMSHNHPNGHALPSNADIDTTIRFAKVLDELNIRLVDHLIMAENDFVSLKDSGLMPGAKGKSRLLKQVADNTR